jgi:single-strand selective monofunctional uracil DNA glycosylase
MTPVEIAHQLSDGVDELTFTPPVTHVYNPLAYAQAASDQYLTQWARPGVKALLLGMNPGPWGMAQTGVPFGEVNAARDFLAIDAAISRPDHEHPKRPIEGLRCDRSEVSGRRLWEWAREDFGTAEAFFDTFFVWNYCPLAFLEESGKNRTPDKLPAAERAALFPLCDLALQQMVAAIRPGIVIGIGAFATKQAKAAGLSAELEVGTVLHPSPASPAANRGWAEQARVQLATLMPT